MRTAIPQGLGERPELDATGVPPMPARLLDLDEWSTADPDTIADQIAACAGGVQLSVGVSSGRPAARIRALAEALTLTLVPRTSGEEASWAIGVEDPGDAARSLLEGVERRPQAALALGQLLRQTSVLPTPPALAAEASVYSMLLGGPEFAAWLGNRRESTGTATERSPLVRLERVGDQLRVTLDRPDRRNAMNARMREELHEALLLAVLDETILDVELRGDGPAFCSGGDLHEFGRAQDKVAAYLVRLQHAPWRLVEHLAHRIHVRVHGPVVGAGLEMAAFAGRVTARRDAFFALPELAMGLVPGAGGTVSVPRRIGRWRTAWMVLSGERVDVDTALQWGLVDAVEIP